MIDEYLILANNETISGSSPQEATDEIDFTNTTGRGPGPARGLYWGVTVDTLFAGTSGTLTFELHQADDSEFTTNDEVVGTMVAASATPAAGTKVGVQALGAVTRRYLRVEATHSGTASGGAFTSYLTTDPQASWTGA